jgi:hypothetical protein
MAAPTPVIPGTRADKQAAHKVARSVIPVRSAGVGIVGVVAPIAHRRTVSVIAAVRIVVGTGAVNNRGANANPNVHLRLGCSRER